MVLKLSVPNELNRTLTVSMATGGYCSETTTEAELGEIKTHILSRELLILLVSAEQKSVVNP